MSEEDYISMCVHVRELADRDARIAQLEAELERHRWISVKERLPDKDQRSKIKAGHDYTYWREIVLPGEEESK